METLSQRLRRLRTERGLSQTELATRSGVQQTVISRMERTEMARPTMRVLEMLAPPLGVSAHELANGQQIIGWAEALSAAKAAHSEIEDEYWEAATRAAPFFFSGKATPEVPYRIARMAMDLRVDLEHRPAKALDGEHSDGANLRSSSRSG
jgi:transcriptional regulator with XRE-family HTH domain